MRLARENARAGQHPILDLVGMTVLALREERGDTARADRVQPCSHASRNGDSVLRQDAAFHGALPQKRKAETVQRCLNDAAVRRNACNLAQSLGLGFPIRDWQPPCPIRLERHCHAAVTKPCPVPAQKNRPSTGCSGGSTVGRLKKGGEAPQHRRNEGDSSRRLRRHTRLRSLEKSYRPCSSK